MSPKQKQINDKLISIVTIALFILFALVIIVFIITEAQLSKITRQSEFSQTERLMPLTDIEVKTQKSTLPATSVTISDTGAEAQILRTDLLPETATPPDRILPSRIIPAHLSAVNIASDTPQSAQVIAYASPTTNLKVVSVSTGSAAAEAQTSRPSVLDGTVMSIDTSLLAFTIANQTNPAVVVTVTPQTRFLITGRPMSVLQLAPGDRVRVEGSNFEGSTMVQAQVVAVAGTTEIINIR